MKLHFQKYGSNGAAIVILHGLFGMLDNWRTIAKKLQENYTVYALDLRNHGRSPHHPEMDYNLMAHDVIETMASENVNHFHLIGHSMGGKVAMCLAGIGPSLLLSLVVVDISPKKYNGGHEFIIDALKELKLSEYENRQDIDEALAKNISNWGIRQFLLKNVFRNEKGYSFRFNLENIAKNYQIIIGWTLPKQHFLGKTAFLYGGASDYITEEDNPLILKLFPKTEFIEIQGSGHWVHAEKPREFLAAVQNFIEKK